MNTIRDSFAIALALAVAGSGSLAAQGRRTTSGGGGEARSAPASSGGRSGASASAPSRSGGSASAPGRSSGVRSGSADARRGGSTATSSGSSDARRGSGATSSKGSTGSQASRPSSGKIGAIRDRAHAARSGATVRGGGVFIGACWSCNYWGWYGNSWGQYHGGWWYPAYYPPPDYYPPSDYPPPDGGSAGQGYQPYPYAGSDSSSDTFARRAPARRAYGAFTMQYFSDVGSTTKAGSVALEGAIGAVRGELEYSHYAEPVSGSTNHLHTLHVGIAAQPRLGRNAYLIAGVAARGVILDDGSRAWGPEGELGLQVFPMRPFGLNVTGRLAGLSWNGNDYFAFRELNTTGSVFISRVEFQGGWHWMKIDGSPAFGGPMLGMRVWF